MRSDGQYTSSLGAVIDGEIQKAINAGMTLESIYVELAARANELAGAIMEQRMGQEVPL